MENNNSLCLLSLLSKCPPRTEDGDRMDISFFSIQ